MKVNVLFLAQVLTVIGILLASTKAPACLPRVLFASSDAGWSEDLFIACIILIVSS